MAFKKKYIREPNREPSEISKDESEKSIGKWASTQRKAYKNNKMSKDRIEKLNSLDFKWQVIESRWEKAFSDYQEFKGKNGLEPLTISKNKIERFLGLWAVHQRINYKKNKLAKDRINKLNSIGFTWDHKEDSWNSSFTSYQKFKEKYGKEPSHGGKEESERILADWATKQRAGYDKGNLSQERIDKLNSIEFIRDIKSEQWERAFEEYKNFKEAFQHEPSNSSKVESERSLAQWCGDQRKAYKKAKISKERMDKLNAISFTWSILRTSWDKSLRDYLSFKNINGREPNSHSDIDSEKFLALWAVSQRVRAKRGNVSKERIEKLNSIKFVWDQRSDWWEQSFKEYKEFKENHKRYPSEESKDALESSLGKWAGHQRQDKKKNKISQDHINKLNSIGFKWSLKVNQVSN